MWKKARIRKIVVCGAEMILIISNKQDITVDFVVHELTLRGASFQRLNTEDIASGKCSITLPGLTLVIQHECRRLVRLDDISAVWYRRPGKVFDFVSSTSRPESDVQKYIEEQWATWLEALELAPHCRWINPVGTASVFENKVRQLAHAEKIGFRIPETLVSNDPSAIRAFAEKHQAVIGKALFAPLLEGDDGDRFIFTTQLQNSELTDDAALKICPAIYQEALLGKTDYRVTVIGDRLFAVRIEYTASGPLDWRLVKDEIKFIHEPLPSEIHSRCIEYVKQAGLVFGALDLIRQEGNWFFIEINPSGEWGWLQYPTGLPIAKAISDELMAFGEP